jgi:aromatic-L-amino-acid decarboxylase
MSDELRDSLLLSTERRRELANALMETLQRLERGRLEQGNYRAASPETLALAAQPPSEKGAEVPAILDAFVEAASVGWDKSAASNFSFIPNGALDAGVLAALLAAGSHAFSGAAFEAPGLVAMEEGVLRWIASILRMPASAGGLLLSGGSLANQTALETAWTAKPSSAQPRMYGSVRVHHSITKAARLIGLPTTAVRLVETDADGRCDTKALSDAIRDDVLNGHNPFLVVATAGSTDTGSIDPLSQLAEVAQSAGAWYHVDAAYGGFFALTERGRERLGGIELADSVTIDAHKGLFLPYGVGALIVRDPGRLVDAHEGQGAYLRGIETVAGLPHYFQRGPELTRPNRAPLMWFPLQLHGTDAFAAELDRMLELAEHAHDQLAAMTGIDVGPAPETSIVTFRAGAGDEATDRVVAALHATGRFQVSTTTIDGRATIRFAFLNPRTTRAIVDQALAVVRDAASS